MACVRFDELESFYRDLHAKTKQSFKREGGRTSLWRYGYDQGTNRKCCESKSHKYEEKRAREDELWEIDSRLLSR